MLKKFIKQFREVMHQIDQSKDLKFINQTNQEMQDNLLSSSSNNNNADNNSSRKMNLEDLFNILRGLNILSKLSTSIEENKHVNDFYNEFKDPQGFLNKNDIFNFLLAILNFYEIYLLKRFKKNLKTKGIEDKHLIQSTKTMKEELLSNISESLEKDLENRILQHKNFGGLDSNNEYLILISKTKELQKEFNLFSIQWTSMNTYTKKKKSTAVKDHERVQPKIDKKSIKLSENHRKKMVVKS